MAHFQVLAAQTTDLEAFERVLRGWYAMEGRSEGRQEPPGGSSSGPADLPPELRALLDSLTGPPRQFRCSIGPGGWILACYQTLARLRSLAAELSRALGVPVLVVHCESNSDTYYLAYYERGPCLRELAYCRDEDEPWVRVEGAALPEEDPAGDGSCAVPAGALTEGALRRLCGRLGIDPWQPADLSAHEISVDD